MMWLLVSWLGLACSGEEGSKGGDTGEREKTLQTTDCPAFAYTTKWTLITRSEITLEEFQFLVVNILRCAQ